MNNTFFNTTWKKVGSFVAAAALIGSIIGIYRTFDSTYARAADLKYNFQQDRKSDLRQDIRWVQDQMDRILDQCMTRDPKMLPDHAYKRYNDYKKREDTLKRELDALIK
jgi:hypothetical protein